MSLTGTVSLVGYERPNQGGALPSEPKAYAYELLRDGKWHPYYRILVAVASRVPPGQAYRLATRRRRTQPADAEARAASVRTGQRAIARDALFTKDRFEHRVTDDGVKQIRMKPFKVRTAADYARSSKKGWQNKK